MIVLCHFGLMAQKDCVDFESFEAAQNWIKELNELDAESRKNSILNKIKCERFFREENIDHYNLLVILNGWVPREIPEYRDDLLRQIKAEEFLLANRNVCSCHRNKSTSFGFLVISVWNKPIIDNIDELKILRIESRRQNRRQRAANEREIRIRLKKSTPQELTFRIEAFGNRESYKTEKIHIERGRKTIRLVDDSKNVKIITITDSDNNEIVMII